MSRHLEAGRIRRALALHVEPIGAGYRVTGGSRPREVVESDGRLACCCEDAVFHSDAACKHIVVSLLYKRLGATLFAAVQNAVTSERDS